MALGYSSSGTLTNNVITCIRLSSTEEENRVECYPGGERSGSLSDQPSTKQNQSQTSKFNQSSTSTPEGFEIYSMTQEIAMLLLNLHLPSEIILPIAN